MTKKGFTLMELLVSIFISGMVMLALVAMWKTSSNHTVQAQRQSVIRNESTIFLRKIYSDFVSASEVICPWGYSLESQPASIICPANVYIAVKEAVLSPQDATKLIRITKPSEENEWATNENMSSIILRNIEPSYTVYCFKEDHKIYRHNQKFLNAAEDNVNITDVISSAVGLCDGDEGEVIMPYVENFILTTDDSGVRYPELSISYTVRREFGKDIPDVYFKFQRHLTKKRGA